MGNLARAFVGADDFDYRGNNEDRNKENKNKRIKRTCHESPTLRVDEVSNHEKRNIPNSETNPSLEHLFLHAVCDEGERKNQQRK